MSHADTFDYVVIGAGSAGSVVAGRLSESGTGSVCVLGNPGWGYADLREHARASGNTTYHLMGMCKMGPASDRHSAVNHELTVHRMEALRVADTPIIPKMPSANINASAIMIGERAVDFALGRQPLQGLAI